MRYSIIFIFSFCLFFFQLKESLAQCRDFAEETVKKMIPPFNHDGHFNGVLLSEGQTTELRQTFMSEYSYRIVICGSPNLPKIEFDIMDSDRNLLFSNKSNNYVKTWDFKPETSQNLIIVIRVPQSKSGHKLNGCVVALFGKN